MKSTAVRYSTTSNNLYITGSAITCTPAELSLAFPKQVVNQTGGIYLVTANLRIGEGATLDVTGGTAAGATKELRLLSINATPVLTNVISVSADYGQIKLVDTKVTSWNSATAGAGAADTEYATYKRAFVNVRSRSVGKESRMDISNTEVVSLGYNASEAYGLSWKVLGSVPSILNTVDVFGSVTGSKIHGNYFGVYTFGAFGMNIDTNLVYGNVKYGLDPHDDSDSLTITNNTVRDNGLHGIICSMRCDNLTVTNNTVTGNAGIGIMFHRSIDNSVIDNNTLSANRDTGIVLYESNSNKVRGNTISGSPYGIRLSMGSSDNLLSGNSVSGSSKYGLYTYAGSDAPLRPGNDRVNRRNVWTSNIVSGSVLKFLKLGATDGDTFNSNDFRKNPGGFDISGAINTTYSNNQADVPFPK